MAQSVLLCVAASAAAGACVLAQVRAPQIEQARQFSRLEMTPDAGAPDGFADFPELGAETAPDDSFGAQVLMKEQPRVKPFSAFAEVAAFLTDNVALTPRSTKRDQFLVISAGIAGTRRLGREFRLDAGVRSSVYRYAEYRELDFQSVDPSIGITWTVPRLRGAELAARYTFTDLTTAEHGFEFYKNHAILLGVQNIYAISRAQAAYAGVSAQWSWADPQESGRDEYGGFAGYRVQVTRSIETDVFYRYGAFVYREAAGRVDHNHALSLTVRYAPMPWWSLSLSSYASFNRSNREEFEYDVVNLGVALQGAIRF